MGNLRFALLTKLYMIILKLIPSIHIGIRGLASYRLLYYHLRILLNCQLSAVETELLLIVLAQVRWQWGRRIRLWWTYNVVFLYRLRKHTVGLIASV